MVTGLTGFQQNTHTVLCSFQLNHVHVNTLSCYSVTKKASCARDCKITQHNMNILEKKLYGHLEIHVNSCYKFIWQKLDKNWVSNLSHTQVSYRCCQKGQITENYTLLLKFWKNYYMGTWRLTRRVFPSLSGQK